MHVAKLDIRASKRDSLRSGVNLELKSSFGRGVLSNPLRGLSGMWPQRIVCQLVGGAAKAVFVRFESEGFPNGWR